ncbi:MalY/PatB family protein [Nocardioides dongkuii]|uniref:MalY/PatB family protein n=1 Tax=Nocardioides dongkuii TaxID=2760089 RepID=UPI001878F06D|nr:aminotransferase class I/II-fold pyridoxal phosphate-dependent enzyme [Nocardioides dongkuii]
MIRDLSDDEARAALPLKWGEVEPGVIPAWVAEMDYAVAPAILDAVGEAVRRGTTGYPPFGDLGLGAAFAGFAGRHWGWAADPATSVVVSDVVGGLRLALEVLAPPGPVVVPLPCYPPFLQVVEVVGREAVTVPSLDLTAVADALAGGARTILLCNPHNPLGTVPTRAELEALRDLARRYDALVVSDEIHGPLTLPGAAFTPYAVVDPGATVVTSHSKTFGTAGLHCAQVLTPDHERLRAVPHVQNLGFSPLGIIAGLAAWTRTDDWLAALVERLEGQVALLGELVAEHLPDARWTPPSATYLAWLDLRAYGVDDPAAAALPHGVRLAPGQDYHPGLPGHVRLNFATSADRLAAIVERLAAALRT